MGMVTTRVVPGTPTRPEFPKVVDHLRDEGLIAPIPGESGVDPEPFDITREAPRYPAPRSARLQALARGETGFMVGMAYSIMRGFGAGHPTIAELRTGDLPVQIAHPLTGDPVTIGTVAITEVEGVSHSASGVGGSGAAAVGNDTRRCPRRTGSTLATASSFGQNERKAIAMSILDLALSIPGNEGPAADEEFVLQHCDALESSGFVEHLKLAALRHLPVAARPPPVRAAGETHGGGRIEARIMSQCDEWGSRGHDGTRQCATPRLSALAGEQPDYNFAFLDEQTKKEIRRAMLKAVAIPGYQVPFASREMPIGRGWGTGGLQLTLSVIGPTDTLKVIDQGTDASVNAVNIRRLVERTAPGVETTTDTTEATVIQSRHRVPEEPLRPDQILVLQVPMPEMLRMVEPREVVTRQLHAEAEYTRVWVHLYEDIVTNGEISRAAGYPVLVNGRYVMSPSPIPRWDIHRLNQSAAPNAPRRRAREADLRGSAVYRRHPARFRGLPLPSRGVCRPSLLPLRRDRHLPGRDHPRGRCASVRMLRYSVLRETEGDSARR